MVQLGARVNLLICQKSKIDDWINHFKSYYPEYQVYDLTIRKELELFINADMGWNVIGVINYELAFRRPELAQLRDFSLMLDESSLIQNETAKRTKFICEKLKPENIILLSGTPCNGKYENLLSQINLLGWRISEETFYSLYVDTHWEDVDGDGHMERIIDGYKNIDRLKRRLREHGCHFLKTEEVLDLPEQIFTTISVKPNKEYKMFKKDRVVNIGDIRLMGDNTLTAMLCERQLCGMYNEDKLEAFKDLVESTEDRLIVFYNFTAELHTMEDIVISCGKRCGSVNGDGHYLYAYETDDNSVTFIQYQAGAMGLNLQKANKVIYFTPPLSTELYEQSKKRIHRLGQGSSCFYYNLTVTGSVEERIYETLAMRKDYTEDLFKYENKTL